LALASFSLASRSSVSFRSCSSFTLLTASILSCLTRFLASFSASLCRLMRGSRLKAPSAKSEHSLGEPTCVR
jgi:hypothetical protein